MAALSFLKSVSHFRIAWPYYPCLSVSNAFRAGVAVTAILMRAGLTLEQRVADCQAGMVFTVLYERPGADADTDTRKQDSICTSALIRWCTVRYFYMGGRVLFWLTYKGQNIAGYLIFRWTSCHGIGQHLVLMCDHAHSLWWWILCFNKALTSQKWSALQSGDIHCHYERQDSFMDKPLRLRPEWLKANRIFLPRMT